jgi:hypothetical protein
VGCPLCSLESPRVSPDPYALILYLFEFLAATRLLKPRRKPRSQLRPYLLVLLLLARTAVQRRSPFVTLVPRRNNRCSSVVPQHRQVCLLRRIALHKVIPPCVRKVLPHLKVTCPALVNLVKVYLLPLALVLQAVRRHSRHSKPRDDSSARIGTVATRYLYSISLIDRFVA